MGMNLNIASRHLCLFAILLSATALWASDSTVYRTVDEAGVVSFSDTPPAGVEDVETLHINTPDPGQTEEYRQRLEDMRETTDRMAADRREREKHRAEMRRLRAASQAQPDHGDYQYPDRYYADYPGYYSYRGYRPWRPGRPYRPGYPLRPDHPNRPDHPGLRPPLRPEPLPQAQINTGSNAQLMRPLVSPRR